LQVAWDPQIRGIAEKCKIKNAKIRPYLGHCRKMQKIKKRPYLGHCRKMQKIKK
jgi:hypothetical protein